jgi:heat shock protein HslJ
MRQRAFLLISLLAVFVLALGGCSSAPAPTPTSAAPVAAAVEDAQEKKAEFPLTGTEWQLETVGGPDDSSPAPAGVDVTLGFGGYRYVGYAGCNWFQGLFNTNGNDLTLEPPAKTQGGCISKPEAANLQSSYLTALASVINYAIEEGKLVLFAANEQRMMTMVPLDAVPFEGTMWELIFYPSSDAVDSVPVIPGTTITARFDGEKLTGSAGCNEYTAEYKRADTLLTLGAIAVTKKTCVEPEGVMEQEQAYLGALAEVGAIIESARSIDLFKDDVMPPLMYHAALEPAQ